MSSADDPEKLLAEALRAKAASTPLPDKPLPGKPLPVKEPETETVKDAEDPVVEDPAVEDPLDEHPIDEHRPQVSGYGLLSGSQHLGYTRPDDTEQVDPARGRAGQTATLRSHRQVDVGVILLLALVLGLAAGAVVGLVTLL